MLNIRKKSQGYDVKGVERTTPVIAFIQSFLLSLRNIVLIGDKKIDSFSLDMRSSFWVRRKNPSLLSNIGSISGACNLSCEFCFRKGNPPDDKRICIYKASRSISLEEVRHRLSSYQIRSDQGGVYAEALFDTSFDPGEFMMNKHAFKILSMMRGKAPFESWNFATNGSFLTFPNIQKFEELRPLSFDISLNSSNPHVRSKLMGDTDPEVAINSISILSDRRKIRYKGSIVAWYWLSDADIIETLDYFRNHNAAYVKVDLPGYSQFFSKDVLFDRKRAWSHTIKLLRDYRDKYNYCVFWQPYINDFQDGITPHVAGVIKNSPAYFAGIRAGDRIISVNDTVVRFQFDLARLVTITKRDDSLRLTIERLGEVLDFSITVKGVSDEMDLYPYKSKGEPFFYDSEYGFSYGMIIPSGFEYTGYQFVSEVVSARKILQSDVWVITSELMYSTAKIALDMVQGEIDLVGVRLVVGRHEFWKGNIAIGDLMLVDDYIETIRYEIESSGRVPKMVFIPSSAFCNGRDLQGRSFKNIEWETGIHVFLIPTRRIIF